MNKPVTKERILAALNKAYDWRKNSIQADLKVVSAFAQLGMRAACDNAFGLQTPKHEFDRTRLELDYIEVPRDIRSLEELNERWSKNIDRRGDFIEKIYELQAKAQISGVVPSTYTLGDQEFTCWGEHDKLRLIDADLEYFRAEKESIVTRWFDYVVSCGLSPYRYIRGDDERWEPCSFDEIKAAVPFYDWVRVWESKDYTSPSIMKSQGYDYVRSVTKYDDDQLKHTVSINFGSGTDRDSGTEWVDFCACNRMPSL